MAQPTNMMDAKSISQIYPGQGLGWMNLGASLQGVISRLKTQPQIFKQLDLNYSSTEPILEPIVLNLPSNGIRLRFDGPDQRLRLIEIIDFSHITFLYKNIELVKRSTSDELSYMTPTFGPTFRHIYNRLFGPSYAGEYIPPTTGNSNGTYILSYPGLAIRFSLKHKQWSEKADFVSLLTTAASPATSIAIFFGSSWPDIRDELYTKPSPLPRSIGLKDNIPDEIENVISYSGGKIELIRRSLSSFIIQLSKTTPQELLAEIGPPDSIYRKNSSRLSIHTTTRDTVSSTLPTSSVDTDKSGISMDDESDGDVGIENEDMFYNYFHHGFDILISTPTNISPTFSGIESMDLIDEKKLVATKIFLHANIPGSYGFNRHRRSRWTISIPDGYETDYLTSEMHFFDISSILKSIWKDYYTSSSEKESFERGMVLNRGWGESPESSIELLGEMDESFIESTKLTDGDLNGGVTSNTQLFGFPGMLFEIVKGDLVSCLTLY